jgi:septum formation protein
MNSPTHHRSLILASGSRYRAELLARLKLPFSSHDPELDERRLPGENAAALTSRLARAKAESIARRFPAAVVVGSDQVAEFEGRIVGKPGDALRAEAQLLEFSGRTVRFVTALALACAELELLQQDAVVTEVRFRTLQADEVRRYVALDAPLDCAGGFKSEAAGSMLLRSLRSEDPTAIIGLPLIALSAMLRQVGYRLP